MNYEDLTLKQINEIQDLRNTCKTFGEWKEAMRKKAQELGISDQVILRASRGC